MNILGGNLDEIANVIIRPARHTYKPTDLGAKSFIFEGSIVTRTDFDVKNSRGMVLKGSYYAKEKESRSEHVLIYLHCNSGCRIEGKHHHNQGLTYLRLAL
jgi:hypothetical protein